MSTIVLKPNEFVIRVEEWPDSRRYVLARTADDYDPDALKSITSMMLAFEKIDKRKNPSPTNQPTDEESDPELDD